MTAATRRRQQSRFALGIDRCRRRFRRPYRCARRQRVADGNRGATSISWAAPSSMSARFGKTFNDVTAYAGAGGIELTSVGGSVGPCRFDAESLRGVRWRRRRKTGGIASGGGSVTAEWSDRCACCIGKGGAVHARYRCVARFRRFLSATGYAGFHAARSFQNP